MADNQFQFGEETSTRFATIRYSLISDAKPYLTTVVIVTILLSVWAGLCAS
jgi:hypothetical protein